MKALLFIILLVWAGVLLRYKQKPPLLFFSTFKFFKEISSSWRIKGEKVLFFIEVALLSFVLLAFFNPKIEIPYQKIEENSNTPRKGIFFLLDRSSSMREKVNFYQIGEGKQTLPKLDIVKKILNTVILERKKDLIGMATFARSADVLTPLTLNHQSVLTSLKNISVVSIPEEDGTNIAYAILKTLYFMGGENYEEKALIIITDGVMEIPEADLNIPLRSIDLEEVAKKAVKDKVKLFTVQIGDNFSKGQYLAFQRVMEKVTQSTGGDLFTLKSLNELSFALDQIEPLKKIPDETSFSSLLFSFRPLCAFVALILLIVSFSLRRTLFLTFP